MTARSLIHTSSILQSAKDTTLNGSTLLLNSPVTINQGSLDAAQGSAGNGTIVTSVVNKGGTLNFGTYSISGQRQRGARVIHARQSARKLTLVKDLIQELCVGVAASALRNAVGQEPDSICFPGTRKPVFSEIKKWINGIGEPGHQCQIMWLTGPAGCGKSAIVQSVSNTCSKDQLAVASFFFRRDDATRNRIRPLVPTLAFQFAVHPGFPGAEDKARQLVASLIDVNPLLFTLSIETQFRQLLQCIQPLSSDPVAKPIILLIDGLDECDSKERKEQHTLIAALRTLLGESNGYRFKIMIASRAEGHLKMWFAGLRQMVHIVHLDNKDYKSEDDIKTFVSSVFDSILSTHPLREDLARERRPTEDDITYIVSKSSGQFLYATAAMQFIAEPTRNPFNSLQIVITPAGSPSLLMNPDNVFSAPIDAVYSYVFSTAPSGQWEKVRPILAAHIILARVPPDYNLQDCLCPLGIGVESVNSLTSCLSAIVQYDRENMRLIFHHASLADFLVDQKRAREYHTDINSFAASLVTTIIKKQNINFSDFKFMCLVLENVHEPSDDLGQTLFEPPNIRPGRDNNGFKYSAFVIFLKCIDTLYARKSPPQEHEDKYRLLLETWLEWSLDHLEESYGTMTEALTKHGIKDGREIWEDVFRKKGLPSSERQAQNLMTEQQRENGGAFVPDPKGGLRIWLKRVYKTVSRPCVGCFGQHDVNCEQ